jgi:hypothetical protein
VSVASLVLTRPGRLSREYSSTRPSLLSETSNEDE